MALVADEQATSWFVPVPGAEEEPMVDVDTGVAHIARVYNYWLDGKDNFAADREAAELVITSYPAVLASVREQREFLRRAVSYLAGEAGITQFLDVGTGLPSAGNTHEIAQEAAPQSRIVYVDNDRCKSGCAHARRGWSDCLKRTGKQQTTPPVGLAVAVAVAVHAGLSMSK